MDHENVHEWSSSKNGVPIVLVRNPNKKNGGPFLAGLRKTWVWVFKKLVWVVNKLAEKIKKPKMQKPKNLKTGKPKKPKNQKTTKPENQKNRKPKNLKTKKQKTKTEIQKS